MLWRIQQAINHLFVCICGVISEKVCNLFRCGRQSGQVVTDATKEIDFLRRRGWLESRLFKTRKYECVDRVAHPLAALNSRR
jgi:hypothetical protein